jgi:hypothetical protein
MVGRELSIHLDVNGQLALAVAVHVHDVVLPILLSYDKKAIGGNIVKNLFRRLPSAEPTDLIGHDFAPIPRL